MTQYWQTLRNMSYYTFDIRQYDPALLPVWVAHAIDWEEYFAGSQLPTILLYPLHL